MRRPGRGKVRVGPAGQLVPGLAFILNAAGAMEESRPASRVNSGWTYREDVVEMERGSRSELPGGWRITCLGMGGWRKEE